jgi:hypothetical protein
MKLTRRSFIKVAGAAGAVGCADGELAPEGTEPEDFDAGPDQTFDANPIDLDAAIDEDASVDAASVTDAPEDVALDGGADASADVPTDVGEDAGSDDVIEDVAERLESGLYVLNEPRGPSSSPWRVVRGGSETTPMNQRTSMLRRFRQPGDQLPWVGFRCVW